MEIKPWVWRMPPKGRHGQDWWALWMEPQGLSIGKRKKDLDRETEKSGYPRDPGVREGKEEAISWRREWSTESNVGARCKKIKPGHCPSAGLWWSKLLLALGLFFLCPVASQLRASLEKCSLTPCSKASPRHPLSYHHISACISYIAFTSIGNDLTSGCFICSLPLSSIRMQAS